MKQVSGEIIHKKIRPSQGLYFGRKRYLRKTAISFGGKNGEIDKTKEIRQNGR